MHMHVRMRMYCARVVVQDTALTTCLFDVQIRWSVIHHLRHRRSGCTRFYFLTTQIGPIYAFGFLFFTFFFVPYLWPVFRRAYLVLGAARQEHNADARVSSRKYRSVSRRTPATGATPVTSRCACLSPT